jgi:hypothetical protein
LLLDCCGADRVSDEAGRTVAEERLPERLVVLRAAGRDFGVVVRGRDTVDFGLAVVALGLAVRADVVLVLDEVVRGLAAVDLVAVDLDAVDLTVVDAVLGRAVPLVRDRDEDADRDRDAVRGLAVDVRDLVVDFRDRLVDVRLMPSDIGLTADMVLAAAVSAFAAVDMDLVAVFIARMADDIVRADAVALVAAAVILVAAEFTLVAAEETFLAAVAGVEELRLVMLLRAALLRVERAALKRDAEERDAVDRDAVLRVDRDAELRAVDRGAELRADVAVVLRRVLGLALDDLVLDVDFGRLAVPLDALRLTDLLRAVLAELRRVAARVVD